MSRLDQNGLVNGLLTLMYTTTAKLVGSETFVWVHALLIRQSGDTETNPGPRPNLARDFQCVSGT